MLRTSELGGVPEPWWVISLEELIERVNAVEEFENKNEKFQI